MKSSQLLDRFGDSDLRKIVVNLGVGGEIEYVPDIDPKLPSGAIVSFTAKAKVGSLKITPGESKAQLILTVQADTFSIDEVEIPAPDPQLPLEGATAGEAVDEALKAAGKSAAKPRPHRFVPGEAGFEGCGDCGQEESASVHTKAKRGPRDDGNVIGTFEAK